MSGHVPIVSIGMPVYNGEIFLREALDSLLAQSFGNFELIISDNASSDATQAICLDYQKIDKRIRYIRQAENIGALANFQTVLYESRGQYFMWAACDDKWDSRWIELLYEKLVTSESTSVFGRVKQIDECSQVISNHPANDNLFSFSGGFFKRRVSFFLEFEGKGKANLFYSLHRREMFQQVDLPRYSQDYYALFDWLHKTQFVSVEDAFLYKRIHGMNAGGIKPKSFLTKIVDVVTLKTIYKDFIVAVGYLPYASGLEKIILTILIPIKILSSHVFYIQRIFNSFKI
jgi:glycosyltransferase involved in cell wall biosynthesis